MQLLILDQTLSIKAKQIVNRHHETELLAISSGNGK